MLFLAILLNQIFFSPLPHPQKQEPVFNPSPLVKQLDLNSEQTIINLFSAEDLNSLRLKQEAQLRLQPSHRDVLFNLGIIALQQNQLDQAQEWFKKSYYQDPNNQLFKDNKFLINTNF